MNKLKKEFESVFDDIFEYQRILSFVDEDCMEDSQLWFLRDVVCYFAYGKDANLVCEQEDGNGYETAKFLFGKVKERIDEIMSKLGKEDK